MSDLEPSRRLSAYWSKRERDIMLDGPRSPDRHLLHNYLSNVRPVDGMKLAEVLKREGGSPALAVHAHGVQGASLIEELERRGYDIKTLRFRVDIDAAWSYRDGRWQKP